MPHDILCKEVIEVSVFLVNNCRFSRQQFSCFCLGAVAVFGSAFQGFPRFESVLCAPIGASFVCVCVWM